ncbi:MAG: J domain-containing protein [Synechococcus sp.]
MGCVSGSPSHYERLGVAPDADALTLRQAFRRRSKALHPDTTSLPAAEAARQFQQLREAYDLLLDPRQRAAYDAGLAVAVQPSPVATPGPQPLSDGWGRVGERRPLSRGEWWALVLLVLALAFCLLLGLGGAWARGLELQVRPSWMATEQTSSQPLNRDRSDETFASRPDASQSAFPAGS